MIFYFFFFLICTYVRMPAGYANEVGEAFRALVPVSLVWGSYAVATAYVTADAVDKGKKAAVVRYYQNWSNFHYYVMRKGYK